MVSLYWMVCYMLYGVTRPMSVVSLYLMVCYMGVTRPMSVVSLYWMVCYMLYGCDQTKRPHSLVGSHHITYNIPSNIERPYSLVWSHLYNIPSNIERPHSLVWSHPYNYMGVTRPMSMVSLYWMVCYMLYGCDQTNEYGLSIFDGHTIQERETTLIGLVTPI
jgi:hypothetical protein